MLKHQGLGMLLSGRELTKHAQVLGFTASPRKKENKREKGKEGESKEGSRRKGKETGGETGK